MHLLDKVYPKQYQQLSFIFDEYEEIENESNEKELSSFNQKLKKGLDYNPKKDN